MQRRRPQAACHPGRQHQSGHQGRDAACGADQLILRAYQSSDLSGLLTCWEAAIRSSQPVLTDAYIAAERRNIATYMAQLATTVAGNIQGFIAMQGSQVSGLFVHPDAQGKGLGARLLRSQNARTIEVFEANTKARRFYARHGFRPVASRVHPETGLPLMCLMHRPH